MREVICGIYEILNTANNKRYIGQSIDIYRRWTTHQRELRRGSHANEYLQRAWDKYGEDVFQFRILEICVKDILNERECYYIELHNTRDDNYGYNLQQGGSSCICTDEARENMSAAQQKAWTDERRKQHSIIFSGENNPFFGKKHTEETRDKVAQANRRRQWSEESRKKLSQSLTGKPGTNTGKSTPQEVKDKISHTLKGRPSPNRKEVVQLDLDGKYITSYESRAEAERQTGVCKRDICNCCNGKRKRAGGYLWKNKEDFNEQIGDWMDISISNCV